jgi:hypothetical protein
MEVCRRPFDPFIYHGRSVNAHLILIERARRSIGRIGRAGGLGGQPAPQTTLGRTRRVVIGRIRVKTKLHAKIRFYVLSLINTVG